MNRIDVAPGHWLAPAAAASWARMRAAGMPAGGITEAGRTRARQEYLYAQYLAGRLVAYAAEPGTSKHETGRAVDMKTASDAHAWLVRRGAAHGWHRPLLHASKPEPWHWEYDITRDQHLTAGTAPVAPITQEDDVNADELRTALAPLLAAVQERAATFTATGPDGQHWLIDGVLRRPISEHQRDRLSVLAPPAAVPYLGGIDAAALAAYADVGGITRPVTKTD